MKILNLFAVILALPLFAYEGPVQEITLWRGEETIVRLEDKLEGELKELKTDDEVKIIVRVATPIPYTVDPNGAQLSFRYDYLTERHEGGCACEAEDGPVYLKISVPAKARPGVHDLGPVTVRVVDRVLPPPKDWKYLLDLWQHPWSVARIHNVEPFSKEHYEKMATVWKNLAWCGVKPITATLIDLPWNHQCYDAYRSMIRHVKHADGSWTHDYKIFDEYVAFARKCGLGPRIDCYTMCPWGYMVRWENDKGEIQRANAKPGTDAFNEFWGAFLPDFAQHLKDQGWFKDTFIAMDERTPEDMKIISEFIRAKAPGLKLQTAGNQNPANFKDITIDSFCIALHYITPEFLKESEIRRQNGLVTTFYVCCNPDKPNTFMSSDDLEAFWLGAFPAIYRLDGFLRWAANSWPKNPTADAAFGHWKPGDTFLIYPDGNLSTRLLNLRAGVVAAEKWRILSEQKLFEKERTEFTAKWGDHKRALEGQCDHSQFRAEFEELVNR